MKFQPTNKLEFPLRKAKTALIHELWGRALGRKEAEQIAQQITYHHLERAAEEQLIPREQLPDVLILTDYNANTGALDIRLASRQDENHHARQAAHICPYCRYHKGSPEADCTHCGAIGRMWVAPY